MEMVTPKHLVVKVKLKYGVPVRSGHNWEDSSWGLGAKRVLSRLYGDKVE